MLGEEFDAFADLVIGDVLGATAGFLHDFEGVETVGRGADGEGFGDGVGFDGLEEIEAGLLGRGDGGAAGGLGAVDVVFGFGGEAELDQFLVALVNFCEERAGGHGDDGVLGGAPAGLLDDFKAHALGAFGVVGAHIDVDEGPGIFAGDFGAEAVDFVVVAFDADDGSAVNEGVEDFALLEVGGDEDVGFEAGGGGVGGDGVGEVAGGGAGDGGETEFLGAAEGDADDAVLEGEGGVVDGVVFDPEFADAEGAREAVGFDEGRGADFEADGRFMGDGKEFPEAPHTFGPGLNDGAGHGLLDALVIVNDFEGAEIEVADMGGGEGIFAAAFAALERLHESKMFLHTIKTPLPIGRRGVKVYALLIFSRARHRDAFGLELALGAACAAGCRGFTGPVPPPLAMRFVISTNADSLIHTISHVNVFFFRYGGG